MSDFEYFFSFFGLLLGLTVAEIAVKFADAIDEHRRRPIGILTPLLAVFVLLDITSFWLWTWSMRDLVTIGWSLVYAALVVAFAYFLSAALIFPRGATEWASLDDHYWHRKRYVLAGVLVADLVLEGAGLARALPAWNDWWHHLYLAVYYGPLIALFFIRSRRGNIILLGWLILQYMILGADILPSSHWGDAVGINGDAARAASTSAVPTPR